MRRVTRDAWQEHEQILRHAPLRGVHTGDGAARREALAKGARVHTDVRVRLETTAGAVFIRQQHFGRNHAASKPARVLHRSRMAFGQRDVVG